MAGPLSLLNSKGQSLDTIIAPDGTVLFKLGVGTKAVAGQTAGAAWQGAATHAEGDTFVAADGVSVVGGVDDTDIVRRALFDEDGRQSVRALPTSGVLTDRSDDITAGGTAQVLAASNLNRRYLFIQNLDGAEDLWISLVGTAVVGAVGSIKLVAGASFDMERSFISTGAISVIAATTNHKFTAYEGEAV